MFKFIRYAIPTYQLIFDSVIIERWLNSLIKMSDLIQTKLNPFQPISQTASPTSQFEQQTFYLK